MSDSDLAVAIVNAERALRRGDATVAERETRSALLADPNFPEAHYLLGELARRRGQTDLAQRHYRKAIQIDGRVAQFHHALGNAMQDAGQTAEAIDAYRRALRVTPDAAEIWNDLGTAYFAIGEAARAADCYRRALRYRPGGVVALSNLGSALRALGDVRGAVSAYAHELWHRVLGTLPRARARTQGLSHEAAIWMHRGSGRMAAALVDRSLAKNPADPKALAVKAELAEQAGQDDTAIDLLKRALAAAPGAAQLWRQLARVHAAGHDYARASEALRNALRYGVRRAEIQRQLALSLADETRFDEAAALLESLARRHDRVEDHVALARVNLDRANFSAAESALERALAMDNRYAPALVQLARLSILRKQAREGLQLCDSALQNDAFSADGHYWRGRGLGLLDDWKDAALAFREAIEIGGADAMRTRWLAVALRATGRLDESEAVLQEALRRWPGDLELRSALVVTIFERGDVTRARELLHGMLADKPDHVPAIAAMAFVLDAEGNLQAAQTYAREALQRDPDNISAHHNLGLTLLKLGRYEEGWQHYEWRKELEQFAAAYLRFPFPEWTGENLAGKAVLVYAEQGLGDEIMFASCLPELLRRGAKVFIECEPRLGELFERSFPACTVFARVRTQANAWVKSLDPQPDWQIPIASLGRHFRRDRSDFPPHSGYLRADPAKLERWRSWLKALGPGVKIGLSWRGGLAKTGRERRSLELAEVESLLKMDGVRFVSLQYGRVSDELARLERLRGIHVPHIQEAIDDYDECAGLIGALDCVVSVCTSVVHLTGALGRPALVLAPYSPEWRYGFAGDTMPWYPSVKVFRQSRQGEWGPVLTAVRAQLLARAERA